MTDSSRPLPVLPLDRSQAHLPLVLMLRWLARRSEAGHTAVACDSLPPNNAWLPDALGLAGIKRLVVNQRLEELPCWWLGARHRVALVQHIDDPDPEADLVHSGQFEPGASPAFLPTASDPALAGLLDIARLEDATAAIDGSLGASWDHILAATNAEQPLRVPPVTGRLPTADSDELIAWNPLPFARRTVALLPCPRGELPWALVDDQTGARYPLQVVDGALGRQLLCSLELGALERRVLRPHDDPVNSCHWEVDERTLDNGRVRAELDERGKVVRLQIDGVFLPIVSPWFVGWVDGLPLSGSCSVRVVESGPVRSRVAATIDGNDGVLQLLYTLHAHDDCLQVSATWHGQRIVELELPCGYRRDEALIGRGCDIEVLSQAPSMTDTRLMDALSLDHLTLGASVNLAAGVQLCSASAFTASATGGCIRLQIDQPLSLSIGRPIGMSASLRCASLRCLGRGSGGDLVAPPAFRLEGLDVVTPHWVRQSAPGQYELLVAADSGAAGRLTVYPTHTKAEPDRAWASDLSGEMIRPLNITPESDGWTLDLHRGELALVTWLVTV